jgi:putative ABC transport system permease protein
MPDVEGVDAALVSLPLVERVSTGSAVTGVLVQGWLPENFGYQDMRIVAGRKLTEEDTGQWRCLLGVTLADNLKLGVGGEIRIEGKVFTVVGVFESINVFENGAIITLLKDFQKVSGRKDVVTGFSLRVRKSADHPDADVERVKQKIESLTDEEGNPYKLSASPPKEYLDKSAHIEMTRAMAWVVSAVALFIGVISMTNTMAMAVLERTQEIGILRAIGWPRRRIILMVLGEALFLSLAAGAIGAAGAVALTYVLTLFPLGSAFVEGGISPRILAQGIGITVAMGLVGGSYPAFRAARLLPTEAIRHD